MIKEPGIYLAIGPTYELLIRVLGKSPTLKIISGIRLNDFAQTGDVIKLKESDLEIQNIYTNPENFIFSRFNACDDDILEEPPIIRSGIDKHVPNMENETLIFFKKKYQQLVNVEGRGVNAFISYCMEIKPWNIPQCRALIREITSK